MIRAARDMGIETVAVHSSADRDAMHVGLADSAIEIGPPPAVRSYLDIAAVLDAAARTGADAVHPGYGFLAERADFARACADHGLVFVGPGAETMELLGDKVAARAVATAAGVPVVPGSAGPVESAAEAAAIARAVGYPVMLKAVGGGGGRGLRVVNDDDELAGAFGVAAREAGAGFGDPRLYVERCVATASHVEVQILGDGTRVVAVGERDCSLQRRRQKVIEEAPAPRLDPVVRPRLSEAAVRLCEAVGYRGAGTVEFLVDARSDAFYFIEVNTRIQVEHPVSEIVFDVDLVAEQLRIAAGGSVRPLSAGSRHALELRICAEDPAAEFAPSPGRIDGLALPTGPWVRVDTWIEPGTVVSPYYDSLLAKLIVWGPSRATVVHRARRALDELRITGIKTTVPLLAEILRQGWFEAGEYDTLMLERWLQTREEVAS
ncbi:ATP-grasp domain-containing protein [Nocardia sp. NBC_00508]|nr:ATP-grasp domain-containing protein [Nocardia sp. NBC_00508]